MKLNRIVAAGLLLAASIFSSGAMAQCTGQAPARTICGNPGASQGLPRWVPSGASIPAVAQGDILYGSAANVLSALPAVQAGQPLISGGVATAPLYAGSWARFLTSSQRLVLSRNATTWAALGNTSLHIAGGNSGEARVEWTAANSDSVGVFGRMNGTFASPTPLIATDQVMGLIGVGIDTAGSTTMQQGGALGGYASQNWTSTHHGYYFQFSGINDNTVDLVNFGTFKNQKAGFGNEISPQYGVTYSANATTGIASPFSQVGFGAIGADSGGSIGYEAIAFSNTALVNLYRANGTNAAKTAPTSGQQLGGFFGNGWDAAAWRVGAGMYAVANQNWSSGIAGTRLDFYANADGGTTNANVASLSGGGTLTVSPTSGTTNKGLSITQTFPSSGTPVGPVLGNTIDVTNPGLGASGAGHDNFGGQSLIYGFRATMSITGTSSGSGSAAFGAFTNIAAASDGFGGSHGVTISGASPAGHNAWGHIGYGIVFNGGQIGLLVGVESEMGVSAGGTASFRIGHSANSQGPVQGSTLDAAFAANTINIAGFGGNAAAWQHLMALSGSMYSGIGFPLAATGDFFFSDTAGTVASFANLSNVTVTGNILSFPNLTVGGNGGAVFGISGTTVAGQMIVSCASCGKSTITSTANGIAGSDGIVFNDVTGNNLLFAGVAEASNTSVRFGQTTGNYALAFSNGSSNLGLLFGTVTSVPLIIGTNNANRVQIAGSGCVSVGNATDCGSPGIVNLLTGVRIGNAAASGNVLRGNGSNFVSAQLACADLSTPCITGNQTITLSGDVSGSGTTAITTTLASVASAGTTGSSTAIPVVTIDVKGRTTSITTAAVIAPAGTLTGSTLASGVTASSLTSLGTITSLTATTINAFTAGGAIAMGGNNITGGGSATFTTFVGALTGHASLDLALTGGTMSGAIAMGTNAITGLTTHACAGACTFQSNGSTFAGSISTGQLWYLGGTSLTPAAGTTLTVSQNTGGSPAISALGNIIGQFIAADTTFGLLTLDTFGAQSIFSPRYAGGTQASKTAAPATTTVFSLGAQGWDGVSAYGNLAAVDFITINQTSASDHSSFIRVRTVASGATSLVEAIRIQGSGCLSIGTTTDCGAANILVNGHVLASGTAPTVSSCGVSPSISGSDNFGSVTAGTGVLTTCVINFAKTWGAAPRCVASSGTAIASMTVTATTTQLTIGGTSLTGDAINWVCGSTANLEPTNDNELVAFEKTG